MTLSVRSAAWANGAAIPMKYTADGQNISPPLSIDGVPTDARSLVLICEDPDAPLITFVHWVLYDIPTSVTQLDEGVPAEPKLSNGAVQGVNGWKKLGYGGPSPPGNKPHRYFFRIYAVTAPTLGEPGLSAKQVRKAIQGNTVASAEYLGTYTRSG
jgi:Raf kinase inhibitor-like YbhB/YbcL family protein